MKKIAILLLEIILLTSCTKENQKYEGKDLDLDIIYADECENEIREYVKLDDRKVYTVCISEILLNKEDITLSYYMKTNNIENTIKDLLSNLEYKDALNDGGTEIYQNDKMTVIKCNKTLVNKTNKDIYIGNSNLVFQEDFCTDKTINE